MNLLEYVRAFKTFMGTTNEELGKKMAAGTLPVYSFGALTNDPVNVTKSGRSVIFNNAEPVVFAGTSYNLDPVTITATANATTYLVAELNAGYPRYRLAADKPDDTNVLINIGTVTCDATSITSLVVTKARGIVPFNPS